MSEELLPCPFCGGEARLYRSDENFIVVCDNHEWGRLGADGIRTAGDIAICADMQGKYNFDTNEYEYTPEEIERCKNAAIEAWNTRAERTCNAEQDYDAMDDGIPDYRIWKCSCGESFPFWRGLNPCFCSNCGAKVVADEDTKLHAR